MPRFFAPGVALHVIQRGNNRAPVFLSNRDFRCYQSYLCEAAHAHGLAVHAYVLMTNHVHLLVTPASASSAPKAMQSAGQRYAAYFNSVYRRTGTLWEGRYKATAVDSDDYLLACMRYIEQNPVRARIVSDAGAYAWSSHATNACGSRDAIVTAHPLYDCMGPTPTLRQAAYRALFEVSVPDSVVDAIRDATNNAWALGAAPFRDRIEALAQRRAVRMPLGRPRKK